MFKSLNLFLRHPNTSADVVEGLDEAGSNKSRYKITPRDVPETCIGLKIVFSGTFLNVTHVSQMFNRSNLLRRHHSTSADVVEGLDEAVSDKSRYKSLPGRSGNMNWAQNRVFGHISGRNSRFTDV
jgi:ABC-type thiamine transport system substrate-binding protein